MSLLAEALEAIRRERPEAQRRGLELIGVVGSVARCEDGPQSDIDVAYDVVGPASLLDVAHAMNALQDTLGRHVDMVDISMARPRLKTTLERDLVRA